MTEFKAFAIDTAYRCGWTFTQALLSCMTFGQSTMDIDWKQSIFIALGAMVFVLLKQIGKWCFEHINEPQDLPKQNTFNADTFEEMTGVDDEEENDLSEEG